MDDRQTRHVIEIFLPLYTKAGQPFGRELFDGIRDELLDRFGGITAFTRSPADGLWAQDGRTSRDEVIIFEVVTETVDEAWWSNFREDLERRLEQESIMIRSHAVVQL
jgi:hypothetical protein